MEPMHFNIHIKENSITMNVDQALDSEETEAFKLQSSKLDAVNPFNQSVVIC